MKTIIERAIVWAVIGIPAISAAAYTAYVIGGSWAMSLTNAMAGN